MLIYSLMVLIVVASDIMLREHEHPSFLNEKRSFIIGKEEDTTFIHISFDNLYEENSIADDRKLLTLNMLGKASLSKKQAKCGRSINFMTGYLNGSYLYEASMVPYIPTNTLTITLWIMIDDYDKIFTIFKCHDRLTGDFVSLSYNATRIKWEIHFKEKSRIFTESTKLDEDELRMKRWIHIAVTYNAVFGSASIYKNSRLLQTIDIDGEPLNGDLWTRGVYSLWHNDKNEPVVGKLDEIYIINSALSSSEINDIMGVCNVGIDFGLFDSGYLGQENGAKSQHMKVLTKENPTIVTDLAKCKDSKGVVRIPKEERGSLVEFEKNSDSLVDCVQRCCSLANCVGYWNENNICQLFRNNTIPINSDICNLNKKNFDTIIGNVDGQWNIIFISISPDFESCAESVCNEKAYELIQYDKNSKDCFGGYCKNPDKCNIYQDPSKHSLIKPMKDNHQFKIVSTPTAPIVQSQDVSAKLNPDRLDELFDDQKCELDFKVQKARPSKNMLLNHLLDQQQVESDDECVNLCCDSDKCSLAFRFKLDCLLLSCDNSNQCKAHKKQNLNSSFKILYVKRNGKKLFDSVEESISKENSLESNKHCKAKIYRHAIFDLEGNKGEILQIIPNCESLKQCNDACCETLSCNVAFFRNSKCYLIDYEDTEQNIQNSIIKSHQNSFVSVIFPKKRTTSFSINKPSENVYSSNINQYQLTTSSPIPKPVEPPSIPQYSNYMNFQNQPEQNTNLDAWTLNCFIKQSFCDQICVPVLDSYICACQEGYELLDDGLRCKKTTEWKNFIDEQHSNNNIRSRSNVLNYNKAPIIIGLPKSLEFNEGETILIKCNAEGNPKPKILWFKNFKINDKIENYLISKSFQTEENGDLFLDDIKQSHQGDYVCMALNNFGNATATITIKVKVPKKCFYVDFTCPSVCEDFNRICSCPPGYDLSEDSKKCQDIDECQNSTCHQKCNNVPGSYKCECIAGYKLESNGRFCYPDLTCIKTDYKCLPTCKEVLGNLTCSCLRGFTYNPKNNTCINNLAFRRANEVSPSLVIALGALGVSLVIVVIVIIGIIFLVGSLKKT